MRIFLCFHLSITTDLITFLRSLNLEGQKAFLTHGIQKTDMMNNEYIVSTYNAHDLRDGYEFGLRWTKLPEKNTFIIFLNAQN